MNKDKLLLLLGDPVVLLRLIHSIYRLNCPILIVIILSFIVFTKDVQTIKFSINTNSVRDRMTPLSSITHCFSDTVTNESDE